MNNPNLEQLANKEKRAKAEIMKSYTVSINRKARSKTLHFDIEVPYSGMFKSNDLQILHDILEFDESFNQYKINRDLLIILQQEINHRKEYEKFDSERTKFN